MSDQQNSASTPSGSSSSSSSSSSSAVDVQQLKSQLSNRFQANRPLVLKLHSILTWEQDIYPIVVSAFVSFSFLIIYLLNSSVLTTLSYVGIAFALLDLAMPTIAKNLLSSSSSTKLNDKDNQKFDKICLDLAKLYAFMKSSCDACSLMKSKKPKLYYPALLLSLLFLAYVGNKFNNLFLTYLATLFVALYPGLDKKGIPQAAITAVYLKLGKTPPSFASSGAGDRRSSGKRN